MLVWTDPPPSLSAAAQLVNDLDLSVTDPDSLTTYGNHSALGDHTNNVEGVVINNPKLGFYTVTVRAFNVPLATQRYALVVSGPLGALPPQLFLSKTASAAVVAPGALLTYTLSLNATQPISQSIILSDTLPNNTTFVGASDGGVLANSIVQWTIPSLVNPTSVTRTLTVQVNNNTVNGAQIVNSNYRATNGAELTAVGAPVTVTAQSGPLTATLTLTKTAYPTRLPAPVGLITYTLSVSVASGSAQNVSLTDTLPIQTDFVRASDAYTLTGGATTRIRWDLGDLSAGQIVTRTLTVGVVSALNGNVIQNNNYQVSAAQIAPVQGAPVTVTIQDTHNVWLPLVMR